MPKGVTGCSEKTQDHTVTSLHQVSHRPNFQRLNLSDSHIAIFWLTKLSRLVDENNVKMNTLTPPSRHYSPLTFWRRNYFKF